MKFMTFILIIVLLFSSFESNKIRRRRNVGKYLYQFALGLVTELTGNATFHKCLPPEWRNANSVHLRKEI